MENVAPSRTLDYGRDRSSVVHCMYDHPRLAIPPNFFYQSEFSKVRHYHSRSYQAILFLLPGPLDVDLSVDISTHFGHAQDARQERANSRLVGRCTFRLLFTGRFEIAGIHPADGRTDRAALRKRS